MCEYREFCVPEGFVSPCITVSHLLFHLFKLHIHSWPELCHLLLQSNQLPLPRAHVSAEHGDAAITPEIIGGKAEGNCSMRMGWCMEVKIRCESWKIEQNTGENGQTLNWSIYCSDRRQSGRQMGTNKTGALILSKMSQWKLKLPFKLNTFSAGYRFAV